MTTVLLNLFLCFRLLYRSSSSCINMNTALDSSNRSIFVISARLEVGFDLFLKVETSRVQMSRLMNCFYPTLASLRARSSRDPRNQSPQKPSYDRL